MHGTRQHQRRLGVRRFHDAVALGAERAAHEVTHGVLVLDHQHGLGAARHRRLGRGASCPSRRRRLGARQEDREGAALAGARGHLDLPAALPHDAVHRREAQARAPAQLLGGEERLEQMRQHVVVHADAGVAHAQRDQRAAERQAFGRRRARGRRRSRWRWSSVSVPPAGMASRALTPRLAITCSSCPGSAITSPSDGSRCELELDLLAHHAAEHAAHFVHDRVEVHQPRLQHLLPAEGQELAHEPGRPVGRAADLLQVLPPGIGGRSVRRAAARCCPGWPSAGC